MKWKIRNGDGIASGAAIPHCVWGEAKLDTLEIYLGSDKQIVREIRYVVRLWRLLLEHGPGMF